MSQTENYLTPPSRYEIAAVCPSCRRDVRVMVPVEANSKLLCNYLEERLRRAKGIIIDQENEIRQLKELVENQHKRIEQLARNLAGIP